MGTSPVTEQAREALRREHNVRLVTDPEEGTAARQLPPGVYGFTSSAALASPMFSERRYRNFEVHHLAGGPALVGFVSPDEAARLATSRGERVTVKLFPDADGRATALVSIPYDRIIQHREYSIRNGEAIALEIVGPVADFAASPSITA